MDPQQYPGSSAGATTLERPPASSPPTSPITAPVKEAVPAAKETIRETTRALKAGATETLKTAKQTGDNYLADQKARLAGKLDEYSAALDAACESLEQEDGNLLAEPANRAARGLERASNYLRETSRADVLHDFGDLAKRRPEWIFGAVFVAGLAAARFLKATPPRSSAAIGYTPSRAYPDSARPPAAESEPVLPFTPFEP